MIFQKRISTLLSSVTLVITLLLVPTAFSQQITTSPGPTLGPAGTALVKIDQDLIFAAEDPVYEIRVRIANFQNGDTIDFDRPLHPSFSGGFANSPGSCLCFTLSTNDASAEEWQAVLRNVRISVFGNPPGERDVEFLAEDDAILATKTVSFQQTNTPPEASDNSVLTSESTAYNFVEDDFGFEDPDGEFARFDHLTIRTLPNNGTLLLNGANVSIGQEIEPSELNNLVFSPVEYENGANYANFDFTVNDSYVDSVNQYTITIDVLSVNDLPVINIDVRSEVTELDAEAGTVLLTFTATDIEDGDLTNDVELDNNDDYFELDGNEIKLAPAGAELVNSGFALPDVELSVVDSEGGSSSESVEITSNLINDPPQITTIPGEPIIEESASSGDTVLSFEASDQEEGIVTNNVFLIDNEDGYYSIEGNEVQLTSAAISYLNDGNELPDVRIRVEDSRGLRDTNTTEVITVLVNDRPELFLNLESEITEDEASSTTVVASFVAIDEEQTPLVGFTSGTNTEGYYTIIGDSVALTSTGAAHVNAGNDLPQLSLTARDTQDSSLRQTETVQPVVIFVNDWPVLDLTLDDDVVENSATDDTVVARFDLSDEDGNPTIDFSEDSNNEGYYQIIGNRVELTQAGANYVNGGGSLPGIELTAVDSDDSSIEVDARVMPNTIILNDRPTVSITLADDIVEDTATDSTVIATFVYDDEEAIPSIDFTSGTNDEGYYQIVGQTIQLTSAGAELINGGGTLPAISLTVTDSEDSGLVASDSRTPSAEYVNDSPELSLTLAGDLVENEVEAGSIVASFEATDEDGSPFVGFTNGTNNDNYYEINGSDIVLTSDGSDFVNGGGILPALNITATDDADSDLKVSASQTPVTVLVNDAPVVTITLAAAAVEDQSEDGTLIATVEATDEEGTPSIAITEGTNAEGFYQLGNNRITLTEAGAAHVNASGELPELSITATDDADDTLTATDTVSPSIIAVNDPPAISLSLAEDLVEDSETEQTVVATFTVIDEDGEPTISFASDSNDDGYFRIEENRVLLTLKGADFVNTGGELEEFSLLATDDADDTITDASEAVKPVIIANNDHPTLLLTLGEYIVVSRATTETVVATVTATDEDGTPIVEFTPGSNDAGMYVLIENRVLLTQDGADTANAIMPLPPVSIIAIDDANPAIQIQKVVQPEVVEDTDLDGIPNDIDTDDDGDTILDVDEGTFDADGDGIPNHLDLDSDNDGVADEVEGSGDSDGDGTPDFLDSSLDEDGDGIPDIVEGITDVDLDGLPNFLDIDSDGDGLLDSDEAEVSGLDTDSDGIDDTYDIDQTGGIDLNGDGIDDSIVVRDSDKDRSPDYLDRDSDNDHIPDAVEASFDNYDVDGDGQPNHLDQDSDGDGIGDRTEGGAALRDLDQDGIDDAFDVDQTGGLDENADGVDDAFTLPNSDGDPSPDLHDLDSDNDGFFDTLEAGVTDIDTDALADVGTVILQNPADSDNDGLADYKDEDSDNDGFFDIAESGAGVLDTDTDGKIDYTGDQDLDGIDDQWDEQPEIYGSAGDLDNDGIVDSEDDDIDGDGIANDIEGDEDVDLDGIPNKLDRDSDGDGVSDAVEYRAANLDVDGDGIFNFLDTDSDGDGLSDTVEQVSVAFSGVDSDHDGIDDAIDSNKTGGLDGNADGVDDSLVSNLDMDGDGLLAFLDRDTDGDGMEDGLEDGDYNNDGVIDYRQYNGNVKTGVKGGGSLDLMFSLLLLSLAIARATGKARCKR